MTDEIYSVIHLGNIHECVIKNNIDNETIGVFNDSEKPVREVCELLNNQCNDLRIRMGKQEECYREKVALQRENENLKKQLSDIEGQLVMFDQCDNWDYDRVMYTVRHIAEIMDYHGGI